MLQQKNSPVVDVPEDLSILTRCPKCRRQTVQVILRTELEAELANDQLELYCGHCDLTWQGTFAEKDQARFALGKRSQEVSAD